MNPGKKRKEKKTAKNVILALYKKQTKIAPFHISKSIQMKLGSGVINK